MISRRSIARRQAGGPQHQGRPSLPVAEYHQLVAGLTIERAKGRCEYCGRGVPLDPDHVINRSAGGADDDANILMLCAGPEGCHARKSWPYAKGRLVIEPVPDLPGLFRCAIRTGPNKHTWVETSVRHVGALSAR